MHLVINQRGAVLKVKDGQFVVRTPEAERNIPPGKVDAVFLNRSTRITSEAVALCVQCGIDLLFVDRSGQPYARVWSPKFGSVSVIRKNQLAFSRSAAAVDWVKDLILAKMDNQCALLLSLSTGGPGEERLIGEATAGIGEYQAKIRGMAAGAMSVQEIAPQLRAWEGGASRVYFSCLSALLPEAYRFQTRNRRPAEDMFNCLLNYAYGILYSDIEGALIRAGIDPYIGIMHRDEYNRPVLVYDVIERFRIWADYVAADLCRQRVVFREFFDVENDAWWLNAHGKRILIQSMNDYMEEVVMMDRLSRSRRTHIDKYAERFAAFLKKLDDDGGGGADF